MVLFLSTALALTPTNDVQGVPGPTTTQPAPIVFGEVTSEWPSTAALVDRTGQFCTGTLIAPDVVLTAAHCLEEPGTFEVYFGDRPGDGAGVQVPVTRTVLHPDYSWDRGDIALVFLSERVEIPPAVVDDRRARLLLGTRIHYVGYGTTEGTGGEGYKKVATAEVIDLEDDVLVVDPDSGSACYGDSGGPVYTRDDAGTLLVSGVVSFGYTDDCMDLGGNTRTDLYIDWIRSETGDPTIGGVDDPTGRDTEFQGPSDSIALANPEEERVRAGCSAMPGNVRGLGVLTLGALFGISRRRRAGPSQRT